MSDSVDYSKMTVETEIEKSIQPEVGQLRYLAVMSIPIYRVTLPRPVCYRCYIFTKMIYGLSYLTLAVAYV